MTIKVGCVNESNLAPLFHNSFMGFYFPTNLKKTFYFASVIDGLEILVTRPFDLITSLHMSLILLNFVRRLALSLHLSANIENKHK